MISERIPIVSTTSFRVSACLLFCCVARLGLAFAFWAFKGPRPRPGARAQHQRRFLRTVVQSGVGGSSAAEEAARRVPV